MAPPVALFKLTSDTYDGTTGLEEYLVYFEQLSVLNGWNKPVGTPLFQEEPGGTANEYMENLGISWKMPMTWQGIIWALGFLGQ